MTYIKRTFFKRGCNFSLCSKLQVPIDVIDLNALVPDNDNDDVFTLPLGTEAVRVIITFEATQDNGDVIPISVKACNKPGMAEYLTF